MSKRTTVTSTFVLHYCRCVLKYDNEGSGKKIELCDTGIEYDQLLAHFEG